MFCESKAIETEGSVTEVYKKIHLYNKASGLSSLCEVKIIFLVWYVKHAQSSFSNRGCFGSYENISLV